MKKVLLSLLLITPLLVAAPQKKQKEQTSSFAQTTKNSFAALLKNHKPLLVSTNFAALLAGVCFSMGYNYNKEEWEAAFKKNSNTPQANLNPISQARLATLKQRLDNAILPTTQKTKKGSYIMSAFFGISALGGTVASATYNKNSQDPAHPFVANAALNVVSFATGFLFIHALAATIFSQQG